MKVYCFKHRDCGIGLGNIRMSLLSEITNEIGKTIKMCHYAPEEIDAFSKLIETNFAL